MTRRLSCFALLLGCFLTGIVAPAGAAEYEVDSLSSSLSTAQAGAHADFTLDFELSEEGGKPTGLTRDLIFSLPPGFIGNPQNFPRCTLAQFAANYEESACPQDAQVGVSTIRLAGIVSGAVTEPVYNMPSPGGDVVARFGVYAALYPTFINVRVNPIDYSLTASVEGAPSTAELISAQTTFWGVPAAAEHNALRLTPAEAIAKELPSGGRPSGQPPTPFLSNPTDCSAKREVSLTAVSYGAPDKRSTLSAPFPAIGGCQKLAFEPIFSATPTNPEAAAPTGLDAVLRIPQNEAFNDLAPSALKAAVVSLPKGMSINPAAGDGLGGCSADQVGFGLPSPPACPDAAKIGSVEIDVPALEKTLHGAVYQRTPEEGKLFRLWVVTDEQGVRLKLPAEIEADPVTGQLITAFRGIPSLGGNPQVPFGELRLHVFGGPRAPLATPAACGTYSTHYEFSPWSGKPATAGDAPMQISTGCGKGGFNPRLQAGTSDPTAGAFAPFTMTLTRQDGEGNPERLALTLPEGLLAKLGGVELCPGAAASTGACPASSRVGRVSAAAGVGGSPLWIPQPGKSPTALYLAGPYEGAPYSLVAVVPAQAGPFDLGTVVTRAAIEVDPVSTRATVTTDPLPQMLEGVPVTYRALHVEVDRPEFTLNPTGCEGKKIESKVTATSGAIATPSAPYRATDCGELGFKPSLSLRLEGATKRGAFPALRSVYRPRPGEANLESLALRLPRSAFLEQSHIRTICTRVQFAAGAGNGAQCPPGSVYGHARAFSPLLAEPLQGPVILRSSSNQLPDLVLALHGPIEVEASARIDSINGGIRATFAHVPDAPLTKVVVEMQGAKKGLIVNSTDLCSAKHRADARYAAHNARRYDVKPVVGNGCGGGKQKGSRG